MNEPSMGHLKRDRRRSKLLVILVLEMVDLKKKLGLKTGRKGEIFHHLLL